MRKVTVLILKTLVIVFGVLLPATNVALAQIPVSLPHVVARVGDTTSINVMVGNLPSALPVLSFQFNLSYDSTILKIVSYKTAETISDKGSMQPLVDLAGGVARVAAASDIQYAGSGTLISFTAVMLNKGTSSLTLSGFKFNEGNPVATGLAAGQVEVPAFSVSLPTLPDVEVKQDSTWEIPIIADAIAGKGILSYQFTVSYDASLISIVGVSVAGTSSASISDVISYEPTAGQLKVAAALRVPLSGANGAKLIKLMAKVKAGVNGSSPLTFLDFQFNEGDPYVAKIDGSVHVRDVTAIRVIDWVPSHYVLDQNYPNPFNPTTMISFGLPSQTSVTLEVYNILGMKVRTLIAGQRMNAAKYSVEWDGKDNSGMTVPSGVYLYRLHTDKFVAAKKMVLMK
jgi:hypothetical protein